MAAFFRNLLTAGFHGSIVILAVIILRLFLRRTPRKFLCMLWLMAIIRLLMPFEIRSELSLQPAPEPVLSQMAQYQRLELPRETVPLEDFTPREEILPVFTPAENGEAAVSSPKAPREQNAGMPDWRGLAPWIWLAVTVLFLIYTLVSYIRLRFLVREAIRIEGGWECDRIETAFILGFIRPRIYIPMGLSRTVRSHILAHEQTHLEKGDHWFKMLGFVALALHWYNPLVWIAYILLCKDIEMACDERVVQFMELPQRKEYSAALLSCSANRAHFSACPVAFGEVSVRQRIRSVLGYRKPGFWISLAGVAAVAFVAVCLLTSPSQDVPAAAGETAEEQIQVSNVDELLAAIGPDREILLKPGTYNLSLAKTYGRENVSEYYTWSGSYDGSELVIRNVEGLTIRGEGSATTIIETDPRWVNVLRFQNSRDLKLAGFTAGHTRERGECSGGVIYLEGSEKVDMEDLGLYGCGVVGLTVDLCEDVRLTGSEIYECSSSGVSLSASSNVTVSGCRLYDIGPEDFGGYAFLELGESENVTVENCVFSESTLTSLVVSGQSRVTLRNNLFEDNRVRSCAFNLSGREVVLDENRFEENSVRSWYSGYGSVASDSQGNAISEVMLKERYPSEAKEPTQPQLTVHAATVDELIAAIGPNREIILDGEIYDFSKATGYGSAGGDYYYWEDVFDGPGLVIRNVDNLTIRSADGDVKKHTLSAVPRYADVLAFTACSNVTLSGFTAGHTQEPGSCAGGVIEFRDCDNMTVDNCGLYGCGILGVYAEYSRNIRVVNSDIYECSLGGIQMRDTDRITVSGNTFRDLGGDATHFTGCTNVSLDGVLLNPQAEGQQAPVILEDEARGMLSYEEDLDALAGTAASFAEALFRGDEASLRLNLVSDYPLPIEIPGDVVGSRLEQEQHFSQDYAGEMESRGFCSVTLYYRAPDGAEPEKLSLEMCRENGAWRVQYYCLGDSETEILNAFKDRFLWAYLQQDAEMLAQYLSDSYTDPVRVYPGDRERVVMTRSGSSEDTMSDAYLAQAEGCSIAIPFKVSEDAETYTYLNVVIQRKTAGGKRLREWEVTEYGMEPAGEAAVSGGIRMEFIEEENYSGVAMLIDDPSRVFLGTSTPGDFSKEIPGKRIGEMFDVYPHALGAVNAGAFFDDGTDSSYVGSYPVGLVISGGEVRESPDRGNAPGLLGFVGFNEDDVLVVTDHGLTEAEAVALKIRDGINIGPALIIDGQVQPEAEVNSGYSPRTAIGQKEDGTVILLCFNGRVFNSLGASYEDVAREMLRCGAVNACMLQGGSATGMMYRADTAGLPQLYTSVGTQSGDRELPSRRLPTYWMVSSR